MDRTPWNPDWSAAIERVTSLVESLFACRVKFQTLDTFLDRSEHGSAQSFQEQELVFLDSALFDPPEMLRGQSAGLFAFPLRVRRAGASKSDVSLVGVAVIEGLAASDDGRLRQIGEFLQLAVESRIDAFERLLDIEQREREIPVALGAHFNNEDSDPKIIHMFARRESSKNLVEPFRLRNYDDSLRLTQPLLILNHAPKTAQGFASNRLALEIFNKTSMWFFVNINDLSDDAFHSAQAFRDLGRMCIFIPNLAEVSIEKQLRLAEVFGEVSSNTSGKSSDDFSGDVPRLIASVDRFPAQLIAEGLVLPHLVDLMMSVEIELGADIRKAIHQVESAFGAPLRSLAPATKGSNLIPLLGRWRKDENQNPTFH